MASNGKNLRRVEPEKLSDMFHHAGTTQRSRGWHLAMQLSGVVLVLLGIAGLLLPLAPGVLPLLAGVALLAATSRPVRLWVDRFDARLPPRYRILIRRTLRRLQHWRAPPGGPPAAG